jgi:hypothetical protein
MTYLGSLESQLLAARNLPSAEGSVGTVAIQGVPSVRRAMRTLTTTAALLVASACKGSPARIVVGAE